MAFLFDGLAKTITEERQAGDPPLAEYSILQDLYIAAATWWHTGDNQKWSFPFRISGGGFRRLDSEGNELFATADIFLQNQAGAGWRLVAANYEHEIRFSSANLFREDAGLAMWDLDLTTADVIVEFEQSDVNTVIKTAGEAGTGLTIAQINAIGDAIAARTPQAVWEYSKRELTAAPPGLATAGALQSTYLLLSEIGRKVDAGEIALSVDQLGRLSAAVWTNAERKLTMTPITPAEIWRHGERELTGQAAGTLTNEQVDAIAEAVWGVTERLLTGSSGATEGQAQGIQDDLAIIQGLIDEIHALMGLQQANPVVYQQNKALNTGYTQVGSRFRLERTTDDQPTTIEVTETRQT